MKKYLVFILVACGPVELLNNTQQLDSGVILIPDAGIPAQDAGNSPAISACVSAGCKGLICEVDVDNCGRACNCNTGCTRLDCAKNDDPHQCCVVQKFACKLDSCPW